MLLLNYWSHKQNEKFSWRKRNINPFTWRNGEKKGRCWFLDIKKRDVLLSSCFLLVYGVCPYSLKKVMKLIRTLKSSRGLKLQENPIIKSQSDELPSGDYGRSVPPLILGSLKNVSRWKWKQLATGGHQALLCKLWLSDDTQPPILRYISAVINFIGAARPLTRNLPVWRRATNTQNTLIPTWTSNLFSFMQFFISLKVSPTFPTVH